LRFPYHRFRVKQPLVHLGGRLNRPRPVVPITLIGPSDSRLVSALLDTAADDTVFPETVAGKLGVDLTNAPEVTSAGVGSVPFPVRLAMVTLRLTDNNERREWRGWVGFTPAPLRQPLLGFAGCLQFFTASFHGDVEEVELTANPSYPGT
jgi:predicted aspartyl protease